MMMRMNSIAGGSWGVQVQRGLVDEVTDVERPGAGAFLSSSPKGAYTVTRSNNDGSTIFLWRRHMQRLVQSMMLLAEAMPSKFPEPPASISTLEHLIFPSLQAGLCRALELRKPAEEISISILAYRNEEFESCCKKKLECEWEIGVHLSRYLPRPLSTAVDTAIMGPSRELPLAKFSLWVDTRRFLEKSKPLSVSEIILSDDGDLLLEGSVTNFFVVAESRAYSKDCNYDERRDSRNQWEGIEVQTAALKDGVLPGVIRQLVIEVCRLEGIPILEVAPSWESRHTWREAFVTSSLRLVQPVASIQRPIAWDLTRSSDAWKTCEWTCHSLDTSLGSVTQRIQSLVIEKATQENLQIDDILSL
ncbi:unnamed protein product [Sphagnum jensenii]|uniref:Class IV aminotransferase n=1 Tax=Sphagnum jensenii TaxID=128206 RepID=A0ABP0WW44_9BRYO